MSQTIDLASLSRYAARVLAARPQLAAELREPAPVGAAEMAAALAGAAGEEEAAFKRRLRRLRERVLLRVMARDLAARAPLEEVCETMTGLAEATTSRVARSAARARSTAPSVRPSSALGISTLIGNCGGNAFTSDVRSSSPSPGMRRAPRASRITSSIVAGTVAGASHSCAKCSQCGGTAARSASVADVRLK